MTPRRPTTQLAALVGCLAMSACRSSQTTSSLAACDHIFDVLYVQCAQAMPPADAIAHWRQRYEQVCQRGLALPGLGVTPEQLSACATQVAADGCRISGELNACLKPGRLGGDASCSNSLQCQSNSCSKPYLFNPDSGTSSMLACGSCDPAIPVGQPCGRSVPGQCTPGSQCDFVSGTAASCVAVSAGTIGAPCNSGAGLSTCKPGLHCDPYYRTCRAPGGAGAQCLLDPAACAYPLTCLAGPQGTPASASTCQNPEEAGAPCHQDSDCMKGLVCDSASGGCAPATWAGSGQPCSATARCLVGTCPTGSASNRCPVVIADGQPCSSQNPTGGTCDAFASCVNGVCSLAQSAACP
jgi:hypothetical protein